MMSRNLLSLIVFVLIVILGRIFVIYGFLKMPEIHSMNVYALSGGHSIFLHCCNSGYCHLPARIHCWLKYFNFEWFQSTLIKSRTVCNSVCILISSPHISPEMQWFLASLCLSLSICPPPTCRCISSFSAQGYTYLSIVLFILWWLFSHRPKPSENCPFIERVWNPYGSWGQSLLLTCLSTLPLAGFTLFQSSSSPISANSISTECIFRVEL